MVLGPPLGISQPQDQEEFSDQEGRCNLSIWMFQGMFGEVYLEAREWSHHASTSCLIGP